MSRRTLIPPSPESNTPIERVSIIKSPMFCITCIDGLSLTQNYTIIVNKKQLTEVYIIEVTENPGVRKIKCL